MTTSTGNKSANYSLPLLMICGYLFLSIERPWESISWFEGIRIEFVYAICMIFIAFINNKVKIAQSPVNKWVLGLLLIHFLFAPFAFLPASSVDQGIEYGKVVLFYILMVAAVEDEESLKLVLKAFVFSMFFYAMHSLWEFHNGRHVYRMGIVRMIGVDATHNSPNGFGASMVLSLPFVYALIRHETKKWMRIVYAAYFLVAVICIVLTGSRSAFVVMIVFLMLRVLKLSGAKLIAGILVAALACGVLWVSMPEDKKVRIETLWDEDAGPANAHSSARGRLIGWYASWEMFKQKPLTGVGAGKENYIGYRSTYGDHGSFQSHVLYGEVLAEFGAIGSTIFLGLILSIFRVCRYAKRKFALYDMKDSFLNSLSEACIIGIILLLIFGIGGHNFYRPMWLWIAAWSSALYVISNNDDTLIGEKNNQ